MPPDSLHVITPATTSQPGPTSTSPPAPSSPSATAQILSENLSSASTFPMALPMKDRTVSGASERSGRGMHHMSGSPPSHRVGSRSPGSIPSSPTSVNSSSSAIFERDIEPSPSHPLAHPPHATNPHRTPRSKATEQLDQSVPSVLDSAAALLATTDESDEAQIAIEAPVSSTSRGTSSIGSPTGVGSRSPSPTTSTGGGWKRSSMLLNLPSPVQSSIIQLSPASSVRGSGSPSSSSPTRPPMMLNLSPGPAESNMPGGFSAPVRSASPAGSAGSTHYESASSSPTTTTLEYPPHPLPDTPTATQTQQQPASPVLGGHGFSHISHPPSPSNHAHKRLSFISYNDILASTPTATQTLSSLTMPGIAEPPPHLPTVSLSLPNGSRTVSASASAAGSTRNSVMYDLPPFAVGVKEPSSMDEAGRGEWEREGLGRGLEERLEALLSVGPSKA